MPSRTADEIIEDSEKGAFELCQDSSDSLLKLSPNSIKNYIERLIKNRYAMTPILDLANHIFLSMENDKDIRSQIKKYQKRLVTRREKTIDAIADHIEKENFQTILTMSYSSTVIRSIKKGRKVIVLESRPKKEGRKSSKKFIEADVDVEYRIDAAMCEALEDADCVLVGADTISKEGFLNKVGTRPLAICAEDLGTDFYVVADSSKILPAKIPTAKGESHAPEEVWKTDENVIVKNDYFELTSLERAKFFMENGQNDHEEIRRKCKKKEVSDILLKYHPLI